MINEADCLCGRKEGLGPKAVENNLVTVHGCFCFWLVIGYEGKESAETGDNIKDSRLSLSDCKRKPHGREFRDRGDLVV